MNRIQERKKQRREYLKQKGMVLFLSWGSVFGFTVGLIITVLLAAGFIFSCYETVKEGLRYSRLETGIVLGFFACIGFGVATLIFSIMTVLAFFASMRARSKLANLSHVPPVTTDALSAEEVLVRGAEEPKQAQSEVLVRPATPEQETPAEQLLRSSQDGH